MSKQGKEVSMKIGIVLLLSAIIVIAVLIKDNSKVQQPEIKPNIVQKEPRTVDNRPIFEDDYEKAISHDERNVLIIFGADWCKYCNILKGDMPKMNLDGYVVCVVDVSKNKEVRKGITSLPTSIIIDKGKKVTRITGYSANQYKEWLDANRRMARSITHPLKRVGLFEPEGEH